MTEAIEHLGDKIRINHDLKKICVETGNFFANYENDTCGLLNDMEVVLTEDNMKHLAEEIKKNPGYTIKECLQKSLMALMEQHEIPREHAVFCVNSIIYTILVQLQEVAPQKYDRFFQSEWRNELNKSLETLFRKVEKIESDFAVCRKKQICIESSDQVDLRIRRMTNPRIGIDFFTIDDDAFRRDFSKCINNEIVRVRARCREEALYCIINELWRTNESRPVFVVRNEGDWNELAKIASSGNIYIPFFYADEICAIESNTNVFIYSDDTPLFAQEAIVLRARTFQTITNALIQAGMETEQAYSLVSETHGLFVPMKKKIFNGQLIGKPEWLAKLPEKVIKACLLVGQWTEADGDQEIVSSLSEMNYQDFLDCIMPFTKGEEPFVHIFNSNGTKFFFLASVENTWEYIDLRMHWHTFVNAPWSGEGFQRGKHQYPTKS